MKTILTLSANMLFLISVQSVTAAFFGLLISLAIWAGFQVFRIADTFIGVFLLSLLALFVVGMIWEWGYFVRSHLGTWMQD